ncbi:hypothetical protein TYRP_015178 [Tyrophagus putrescentiae]|nr:hypothetical protein TYRP_015178 [Tyrophagus putrescentiae]
MSGLAPFPSTAEAQPLAKFTPGRFSIRRRRLELQQALLSGGRLSARLVERLSKDFNHAQKRNDIRFHYQVQVQNSSNNVEQRTFFVIGFSSTARENSNPNFVLQSLPAVHCRQAMKVEIS